MQYSNILVLKKIEPVNSKYLNVVTNVLKKKLKFYISQIIS